MKKKYTVMAQQKLQCSAVPWDAPMVFHQSTKDISVIMQIEGREGWVQAFEIVVHCALRHFARVVMVVIPTAGIAADAESSNGDGDGRSALAQAQVVVGDGDVNAVGGVPWVAWGPRATADAREMDVLALRAEGNNYAND
jgi:hypothetical protein